MTRSDEFHIEQLIDGRDPYIEVIGDPSDRASLFLKLSQVNDAVRMLGKSGKFNAGNTKYDYATEADVIEPIAHALASVGLATIPGVVNQWWHDLPGKYGTNRVVTVHASMMIGCTTTGAYVVTHTFSTAANGDKASNAAFTTAIKYLLAKLALVAFGDDADAFTADGQAADGSKAKAEKKPAPVSKGKLDDLANRVKDAGAGDAVKKYLSKDAIMWSKMTASQLKAIEVIIDAEAAQNEPPNDTGSK